MRTRKIATRWSLMILAMTFVSAVGCAGPCGCLQNGISDRLLSPVAVEETIVDNDELQSGVEKLATADEPKIVSVLLAVGSRFAHRGEQFQQSNVHQRLQFRKAIEDRGRQNGCGEFFWSSWSNDPPTLADYARPVE